MRRRLAGTLLLIVLVGGTASPAVADDRGDTAKREGALEFREGFGLATTDAALLAAEASGDAMEFGVPLLPAEIADLEARVSFAERAKPVIVRVEDETPGFAGAYFDQHAGGQLVLLGKDTVAIRTSVGSSLDDGLGWRIVAAEASLSELLTLQAQVDADFDRVAGVALTASWIDVAMNQVVAGVANPDAKATSLWQKGKGDRLRVEPWYGSMPATCTQIDCSGEDLRGGLKLFSRTTTRECSSGFVARDTFTLSLKAYLITAGHCASPLSTYADWQNPDGTTIGAVSRISYYDGMYADISAMRISNSRVSNKIFLSNSYYRTITAFSTAVKGTLVCKSGASTQVTCRQVTDTDFHAVYPGAIDLYRQVLTDIDSTGGDSGAPVYYNHTGYGTVAGNPTNADGSRDTTRTVYSRIDFGLERLDLDLCLDASCS